MSIPSSTPSLTPSRSPSPSPQLPVQPDHFYGNDGTPTLVTAGKSYLDPADDPNAQRGIPVFKPTMEEFQNFEAYVSRIEPWGQRSGIVKIIPPQEWKDALPSPAAQLDSVKIKSPIEQNMFGQGGLFRQENLEKRRMMSVREWAELCGKDEFKAPSIVEVETRGGGNAPAKPKRGRKAAAPTEAPEVKMEEEEEQEDLSGNGDPSHDQSPRSTPGRDASQVPTEAKNGRTKRQRRSREEVLGERAALDREFMQTFNPHTDWLPHSTTMDDYTPEFCSKLERLYWRTCGFGKSAWYGADCEGSLFTDDVKSWNVARLDSVLSRILPESAKFVPGVNTPYLYFGMWRATFAWHVEDMDLFSINYIHFGAPKFWYAMPQGRASALESTMRGYFPKDTSQCRQFLRHKSFLASPNLLRNSSCRPNTLVQQAQEIVITFPRGYHAGFNLGLNCAESVNFALESWIELGLKAKACECITDSVKLDVRQLLDAYEGRGAEPEFSPPSPGVTSSTSSTSSTEKSTATTASKKRKAPSSTTTTGQTKPARKKSKPTPSPTKRSDVTMPTLTFKLPGRMPERESYPCCLCVSQSQVDLLPVHDPPTHRKDACEGAGNPEKWMAHRQCADVVPETWADTMEVQVPGELRTELRCYVFGVDGIVKDRWNLKCTACTKHQSKAHGAPVQCTKGKCMKAFHVSCARDGSSQGIVFNVLRDVEKEVLVIDGTQRPPSSDGSGDSQVLKSVKKTEAEVLCPQHNPETAAAKRASKQDKQRARLLSLPEGARIKIRVSSGLFEVTLLRVIEETGCVEVLWDKAVRREFKWSSVVLGTTDTPVQQFPLVVASGSEYQHTGYYHHPGNGYSEPAASSSAVPVPVPGEKSLQHVDAPAVHDDPGQVYNGSTYPHHSHGSAYPHPHNRSAYPHQGSAYSVNGPAYPHQESSYTNHGTAAHPGQSYNGYSGQVHHHGSTYPDNPFRPLPEVTLAGLHHTQPAEEKASYASPREPHPQPAAIIPPAVAPDALPATASIQVDWNLLRSLGPHELPAFLEANPHVRALVHAAAARLRAGAVPA